METPGEDGGHGGRGKWCGVKVHAYMDKYRKNLPTSSTLARPTPNPS